MKPVQRKWLQLQTVRLSLHQQQLPQDRPLSETMSDLMSE